MERTRRVAKVCLAIVLVAVFVYLYCYGAVEHLKKRNTALTSTDQRAYLGYAKKIYRMIHANKEFRGDGARMPLYPFLQSLLYNPDLTEEEFFVRGKYFNIVLSLIILASLFFIFKGYFPLPCTANLTLVTAFTVFIFKAAYFHPALLFYFLNFCAFLLLCRMLDSPSWKLGILTGVVLGIAHLTKASVMLGLWLFLLFSAAKMIHMLLTNRARASSTIRHDKGELISQLLGIALTVLVFLGTIYPYISMSKRVFGSYFYNVSTTFYMWYDSWEEVRKGTKAYEDRKGWPEMPPDQLPSPSKYLREHTTQQIVDRIVNGLRDLNSDCRNSYGYYKYVLIYSAFFLAAVILNRHHSMEMATKHPFLLLFCLSYFGAYLLAYAWYRPITAGNRLILALFLPFTFTVSYVIYALPSRHLPVRPLGIQVKLLDVLNVSVLSILAFDMYFILTERIVTMYGGS